MYTVLGTDAAILLAGPLIEKRFNFIHDLVTVSFAGDVQVHISIADMTVSHASNDIRSKTSLHNFDTVLTKKCNLFALCKIYTFTKYDDLYFFPEKKGTLTLLWILPLVEGIEWQGNIIFVAIAVV